MFCLDYIDSINRQKASQMMEEYGHEGCRLSIDKFVNVIIDSKGTISQGIGLDNGIDKAIYLGHFLNIWGHCITDNLRKCWFLLTPEYKGLKSEGFRLICTFQGKAEISTNFAELLLLLGVLETDICIVNTSCSIGELIVPQDSLDQEHHFTREFKDTINYLISKVPTVDQHNEKIYFSRTHLKHDWRDYGEYMIEGAFKDLGYKIIYPETLSFAQQVQLLQSCDSFVSTDGSIAHNAMFCRDEIECIIICKKVGITAYQCSIMNMRGFDVCVVDAHLSVFKIFATWFGPFFMYANDNLVRFCKDRGLIIKWQFPVSLFLRYCLFCLFLFVRYRLSVSFVPEVRYYCDVLKHNIKRKILFDR